MPPAPRYTHKDEEDLVIRAAVSCIAASSLLDFKMSSISKEAGISMGSVYKHVKSKEDVLIALAINMQENAMRIMKDIMTSQLSGPEKLISLSLVNPNKIHIEPFGAHLEMLIGNEAILKRASQHRVATLASMDEQMEQIFFDALNRDEELLADATDKPVIIERLMIGIWTLCVGFQQVSSQRSARQLCSDQAVPLPFPLSLDHDLIKNATLIINDAPWKHLLTDDGVMKACKLLESKKYR